MGNPLFDFLPQQTGCETFALTQSTTITVHIHLIGSESRGKQTREIQSNESRHLSHLARDHGEKIM